MYVPLLFRTDQDDGSTRPQDMWKAAFRLAGSSLMRVASCLQFGRVSEDTAFLDSHFSRRTFWRFTLPAYGVLAVFNDIVMNEPLPFVVGDVFLLVSLTLATWLLPHQSVRADIMISLANVIAFAGPAAAMEKLLAVEDYEIQTWTLNCGIWVVVSTLLGVRSSAIFGCILADVVVAATVAPELLRLVACSGLVNIALGVPIDMAARYVHAGYVALQKVLDDCSDGFCSIDLETGIVTSTSDKIKTLCGDALWGKPFTTILQPDDGERWEELIHEAKVGNLKTILATCKVAAPSCVNTFDCRLVPYMKSQNRLWICLHIIGEFRATHLAGAIDLSASPGHLTTVDEVKEDAASLIAMEIGIGIEKDAEAMQSVAGFVEMDDTTHSQSELNFSLSAPSADGQREARPRLTVDASTQTDQRDNGFARPPRPLATGASDRLLAASSEERAGLGGTPANRVIVRRRRRHGHGHHKWVVLTSSKRVLPEFLETPLDTTMRALIYSLTMINARGDGCCHYHVSLARLAVAIEKMNLNPCNKRFTPSQGWQCAGCLCMNDLDDECLVCGGTQWQPMTVVIDADSGNLGSEDPDI